MSYNYGSAAEVLNNVFDVIEGGQAATATGEVIADNGAKIFDIATKEVIASNGSAAEVAEVVSVAEGTTAGTTAGAGILAMDVGAAGAAIAPALGIAAGFGLYNLAPEFWTNVSNQLVNAGQTVKGKVQALLMPDGSTAFSKETIEIFKNALLNGGAFDGVLNPAPYTPLTTENPTGVIRGFAGLSLGMVNKMIKLCPIKYTFTDSVATNLNTFINNNLNKPFKISLNKVVNSDFQGWSPFSIVVYDLNVGDTVDRSVSYYTNIFSTFGFHYAGQTTCQLSDSRVNNDERNSINFFGFDETDTSDLAYNSINSTLISTTQPDATLPSASPFETTYPNWLPWEFPQGLPSELPDYYPVSIPTPDITQDPSQSGENAADSQLDKLIELLFNSLPEPDPQIEPDPDAGIDPDPEPATQPNPDPNPPDPNPPLPTPSAGVPLPTVETTRADRMFTVYNPTDTEVNNLGAFLWTSSIIEQIKKLWDDPMQAIISFHKIYGTPTVGSSREIVLGYIESGVNAAVVTSQFCEVDCGSVTVPELNKNATSYSPFTSLHIYLPFVGIMELDTNECMNATLHVKYRIDVYTGTCIAMIYVSRTPDLPTEQMLYSFSGNASQQLPLTSSSFGGAVSALLGLAGAGVAVASGGALGVAAGAVSAAHSLTQEMVHINRSGGLSANAGILAPRKPYLILSRQYSSDANGYAGFYGYPSNKTVYIGNCNGYIKCKDVIFRGSCTQAEAEEIESLLKSGVYI